MKNTRRNIMMPDDLWTATQLSAIEESMEKGRPVSASEWVRDAMEQKLDRRTEDRSLAPEKVQA